MPFSESESIGIDTKIVDQPIDADQRGTIEIDGCYQIFDVPLIIKMI